MGRTSAGHSQRADRTAIVSPPCSSSSWRSEVYTAVPMISGDSGGKSSIRIGWVPKQPTSPPLSAHKKTPRSSLSAAKSFDVNPPQPPPPLPHTQTGYVLCLRRSWDSWPVPRAWRATCGPPRSTGGHTGSGRKASSAWHPQRVAGLRKNPAHRECRAPSAARQVICNRAASQPPVRFRMSVPRRAQDYHGLRRTLRPG